MGHSEQSEESSPDPSPALRMMIIRKLYANEFALTGSFKTEQRRIEVVIFSLCH